MIRNDIELFQRSKDGIWTDPHISKNMLAAHLDESSDAASRNPAAINKTLEWIVNSLPKKSRILDLGCGVGLYSRKLAEAGYIVHGIDINSNSIDYAESQMANQDLPLSYQCADYLNVTLAETYDAIIMIYCDMGALIPSERDRLLSNCRQWLNDSGILIFDVHTEELVKTTKFERNWYSSEGCDFWSSKPYIMLEESKHFLEQEAIGRRHVLIESSGIKDFIIWFMYYSDEGIRRVLQSQSFHVQEIVDDLLKSVTIDSNRAMFVKAVKE